MITQHGGSAGGAGRRAADRRAEAAARRERLLHRGRRVHARRGGRDAGASSTGCAASKASSVATRSISSRALRGSRTCSTSRPPTTGCSPASRRWPRPHVLLGEIRVYSLNGRNPLKGEGQQLLHSDVPRVHATDWRVVNSMVMLDDMTPDNGPTRVVPGSHKWVPINVPDVNMAEVKEIVVTPEDRAIMPQDPVAHPPEGGPADRQGRLGRGDQRPHLAWRHAQRERRAAPGAAPRDRPPRPAAAAQRARAPDARAARAAAARRSVSCSTSKAPSPRCSATRRCPRRSAPGPRSRRSTPGTDAAWSAQGRLRDVSRLCRMTTSSRKRAADHRLPVGATG